MFSKLSNWFLRISNGKLTLAILVIFILFSALILPYETARVEEYAGEEGSPDLSLYYSASELYGFAEAYGPLGRTAYIRARFSFDLIFPLVYGAFLVTAISWLIKRTNLDWDKWGRLNLLPAAGVVFDYLENVSAAIVIARYPQTTAVLDHLAGVFTLIKWVFNGAAFIALLCVAIFALVKWIKPKSA